MAGLRNVRTYRSHKERGQVKHRLHLGELEKKVDYRKRKAIYQTKQKIEKVLKEKQMNKNPDEFYTGMVHTRITEDGFLEKRPRPLKRKVALKMKRATIKEESRWLQYKLKMMNTSIEQLSTNVPLRYVFNNSHVMYNGDESIPLKANSKKLQKKGKAFEEEYNNLLKEKHHIMSNIRKMDNDYMKTYTSDKCYYVRINKGMQGVCQLFGPRLK